MAKTVADIISDLGGTDEVAGRLSQKPGTVRMWRFRRNIPRTVWPDIQVAFPQVSLATLLDAEREGQGAPANDGQGAAA